MKKNFKANMLRFLFLLPLAAFYLSGQSGAETGNNGGRYEGQTLCDAGDDVESSCTTHTGKNLSVCGSRKKNPYIMYMVYGSHDDVIVSSPKEGEFPLKHIFTEDDNIVYFFKKGGISYISYAVFDDSDPENELEGVGFMAINSYNKIVSHDFCVSDVKYKSDNRNDKMNRIRDYGHREEKSPFHISHERSVFSEEAERIMYDHLYLGGR